MNPTKRKEKPLTAFEGCRKKATLLSFSHERWFSGMGSKSCQKPSSACRLAKVPTKMTQARKKHKQEKAKPPTWGFFNSHWPHLFTSAGLSRMKPGFFNSAGTGPGQRVPVLEALPSSGDRSPRNVFTFIGLSSSILVIAGDPSSSICTSPSAVVLPSTSFLSCSLISKFHPNKQITRTPQLNPTQSNPTQPNPIQFTVCDSLLSIIVQLPACWCYAGSAAVVVLLCMMI